MHIWKAMLLFIYVYFFSHKYFNNIKAAIKSALWNEFTISWFKHWKNGATIKFDEKLLKISFVPEDDFCSKFILKFENKIETTRLDESAIYKLFYGNEHVIEVASKEECALMDIALAKRWSRGYCWILLQLNVLSTIPWGTIKLGFDYTSKGCMVFTISWQMW